MSHRLLTVIGTRPQFIKYASLRDRLESSFEETVVDTGQHYDHELSAAFLEEYSIPEPDYVLDAGGGTSTAQVAEIMERLEPIIEEQSPERLLCMGDTNSTLAAALAATQAGLHVAHLEAGERNFDRNGRQVPPWNIPEETNRVLVDRISSLLLCASHRAVENLEQERAPGRIVYTGDVMQDLYESRVGRIPDEAEILARFQLGPNEYLYATVHRALNTDNPDRLKAIFSAFRRLGDRVVIPLHPRTEKALRDLGELKSFEEDDDILVLDPVTHTESIVLGRGARCVITDSGGVVREAYFGGVPSVIVDDTTEWIDLVEAGWATIAGADAQNIVDAVKSQTRKQRGSTPVSDGEASLRVARALEEWFDD